MVRDQDNLKYNMDSGIGTYRSTKDSDNSGGNNVTIDKEVSAVPEQNGHSLNLRVSGAISNGTYSVSDAVDQLGFGKFQIMLGLFTGGCWMADSMEMKTLSILPPALHCALCITSYQQAYLTTVVFVGMMLSSPCWGKLCDRFGRKKAITASISVLFTFGCVSAFSPGYYWLLAFRFFVGVAIGCIPQAVTLFSEFVPSTQRAKCVLLLDFFWCFGSCLEVLLAMVIMPALGWHYLLGISTAPILCYFILCYWLPESARFQAISGQTDNAVKTLERIARYNKKPGLEGRLVVEDIADRGRFQDLFRADMRRTTILLWCIWLISGFCLYGIVFLSTQIFEQYSAKEAHEHLTLSTNQTQSISASQHLGDHTNPSIEHGFVDGICTATRKPCQVLTTQDYLGLLWITLAEIPGLFLTMFIIDRFGRKKTMALLFVLFAMTILTFVFNIEGRSLFTSILFAARGLSSAAVIAGYVYTPEVYPTSMRSIGIGSCSSMSRVGAMITPYVAQVLSETSIPLAVTCYGVAALIAAVLSMMLPVETKGKAMPD